MFGIAEYPIARWVFQAHIYSVRRTDNANHCEAKKCELEAPPRAISIDLINDDADSSSVSTKCGQHASMQDVMSTDVRPKRRIVILFAKIRERSECAGKR